MTRFDIRSAPSVLSALDWLIAAAALAVSAWMIAAQWPNPSLLAWAALAFGVAGLVMAWFNPLRRVQGLMLRRLVKKPR